MSRNVHDRMVALQAIALIQQLFSESDVDESGFLDRRELACALRKAFDPHTSLLCESYEHWSAAVQAAESQPFGAQGAGGGGLDDDFNGDRRPVSWEELGSQDGGCLAKRSWYLGA